MFFGGLNGDGFFGEEYDDFDVGYEPRESIRPSSKSCKYCGKGGLYWHKNSDGWRLYNSIFTHNSETLHTCERYLPRKINNGIRTNSSVQSGR